MLMAARGDKAAYEMIYSKYFPMVTHYIAKLDRQFKSPEDLAQEVFARIWNDRTKYSPKSTVKTYLFSVTKNVVLENQRRKHRQIKLLDRLRANCNSRKSQCDCEKAVDCPRLDRTVELAKSRLSEKQSQALELVFYSGFSISEAARLAGCSADTFRRRLYNAKNRLSAFLRQSRKS